MGPTGDVVDDLPCVPVRINMKYTTLTEVALIKIAIYQVKYLL